MRITALIAASVAALALATLTTPASAASSALQEPAVDAGSYYVMDNDDLGLGNDRGHLDRHDIGANSASMQLIDTAALGAAGLT